MSIFPATDLVTEVAQAADPIRRNAAVARLSELSSVAPKTVDAFARLVPDKREAEPSQKPSGGAYSVASNVAISSSMSVRPGEATQKFEAFIIQSCLEAMLPKSQGLFGRGAAGDVWRSMIAEQIGDQIAKSGALGLHKLLDREMSKSTAANSAPSGEAS